MFEGKRRETKEKREVYLVVRIPKMIQQDMMRAGIKAVLVEVPEILLKQHLGFWIRKRKVH